MKDSPLYKTLVEEFKEFSKKNKAGSISSAKWFDVESDKLAIVITRLPTKEDYDQSVDIQKIIEFYSK